LRGVSFLTAVALVAEPGDLTRFRHPRELMAYLGLVPSEYSSGPQARRGAITKAGNPHVRRLLAESAWGLSRDSADRAPARGSAGSHAEGRL
jgi:transposase